MLLEKIFSFDTYMIVILVINLNVFFKKIQGESYRKYHNFIILFLGVVLTIVANLSAYIIAGNTLTIEFIANSFLVSYLTIAAINIVYLEIKEGSKKRIG